MPNNNKKNNKNNKKGIELLPEELRRKKEEKEKKKEGPGVEFYIPPREEKSKVKISLFEKIFGTKEEREKKKLVRLKVKEEKRKKEAEEKARLLALRAKEKKEVKVLPKKVIPPPQAPKEKVEEKRKPRMEIPKKPEKPGIEVTLMPGELLKPEKLTPSKQLAISLVIIMLFCLLLGILYLGLFIYQAGIEKQLDVVRRDVEAQEKEIAVYEDNKKEALELQVRFQSISELLTNHIYWTNFFKQLERNTVPDVYYTNFIGSTDGGVIFSAVGKNYSAVAQQLAAFREAKDFVARVSITGASAQVDEIGEIVEVNFEIKLSTAPQVFLK